MKNQSSTPNYLMIGLSITLVACLGICGACIPWGGLSLKVEPFHGPASTGNWPAMQKLLDNGLPVDAEDQNGNTALYYAVSYDKIDFAQKLVDRGANVLHRNHRNRGVLDVEDVTTNKRTLDWVKKTLEKAQTSKK